MASVLFVFPHPDDESFGPGPALARLRREGHAVHLLTLTRGEATSQRERLGYSKEEMGAVRAREMEAVAGALDLSSLTVLQYPDGELAAGDPLALEATIEEHVEARRPDVVVTYPVHGISGHPDHLVTHAVVKRVVAKRWRDGRAVPRRLAFFVLPPTDGDRPEHLQSTPEAAIGACMAVTDDDLARGHAALACYETYAPVIEAQQPLQQVTDGVCFQLWGEAAGPRRTHLLEQLPVTVSAPAYA
ncbi:PIG-L deacetylase family protein [Salisaeta longa]|uniref:PIG-L deacetylase family protein n=1 Tax=Salisaeta longa TaxID=503170 RepID=UPI0003B73C7A|nr:PIG-L family deacetylase [Salisaeta longa]